MKFLCFFSEKGAKNSDNPLWVQAIFRQKTA